MPTQPNSDTNPAISPPTHPVKQESGLVLFLIKWSIAVFLFRCFAFSLFSIPSESMLPTLANGDYLIAEKWPYGFSNNSLPFAIPGFEKRIFARQPERGDIVIFKHPVNGVDYVKRVVGLPGDTIAMKNGVLVVNEKHIPQTRTKDFTIAQSPNTKCHIYARLEVSADGTRCHYVQLSEALPNGAAHNILDFGMAPKDNFGPILVPDGKMFVLGDNRDNSQDSRFAAEAGGGVGMVDQDLLIGRAVLRYWSTDGSASYLKPWTWFTALRFARIGRIT